MAQIYREVRAFNAARTGLPLRRTFTVELRDAAGALVGGLAGAAWAWSLHIDGLWVHDDYRQHGYGSALMARAEAHGRTLGARLAYVETLSFQARPFYEKHGYRLFGTLESIAPDTDYYFLTKRLA